MSLCAPPSVRTLKRCAELSDRYGVPVHIHLNETLAEVEGSLKEHGKRPLARLSDCGLLTDRLIAVHNVHATEEELAALAQAGASMAHCPCSNLKLASGFAPVAKAQQLGVNLGIGTDGVASNDKLDMLGETRLAAMLAKAVIGDTTHATVADMLEAATLGGARALKWDSEIGSLEKGKAADIIAINLATINTLPVSDPAAQILYSADRENITHTWVAGELIADKQQKNTISGQKLCESAKELCIKWQNRM